MTNSQPRQSRIVPCPKCASLNRIPLETGTPSGGSSAKAAGQASVAKCGKCHAELDTKSTVFDVNTAGLRKIVLNSPLPVLVDFWAPWCGPCVSFAPTFKQFSQAHAGQVIHLKLDTEANADAGTAFNIRSIPTLMLFENEREKARQSGAMPLPMLTQWVKGHVPALGS